MYNTNDRHPLYTYSSRKGMRWRKELDSHGGTRSEMKIRNFLGILKNSRLLIITQRNYTVAWTLHGRRPGCAGLISGRTASSLENKCLDAVHDRPFTL